MERFKITVSRDKELFHFEVADYLHHEGEQCKFELFKDDQLVAAFEPDSRHFLRICKNPGNLEEEVLYLVADKLENYQV